MTDLELKRYSKPRGAGDQTSGGRDKFLKPISPLSHIEILVRETLQNSWDARDEEWYPAYGLRVYRVRDEVRSALREQVFTRLPSSLDDLHESLASTDLHAVEVFDRGTSGLDGPFRASEVAPDGTTGNFNSFVFDIGTTKDSEGAGGTFGFGKNATFEVSRCYSVVYWSRCRNAEGELEHRLIAATLHDPYVEEGARFTGAHWWGDPHDTDIVPLRGQAAADLGNQLFKTGFGEDETGTSILIIDPVISIAVAGDETARLKTPVRTDEHADELVEQLTDALGYSAWSKTVPDDGQHAPMKFLLYKNGVDQEVAETIRRDYQRFADSLVSIRAEQGSRTNPELFESPIGKIREKLYEIRLRPARSQTAAREEFFGSRSDNVVGHLHLTSSIASPPSSTAKAPRNRLCLMRSQAELVVRYDPVIEIEDEHLQWHGVFKPTPECDHHFASSEPPTHDGWTPDAADNEVSRYVVEKALGRIRARAREFLAEGRPAEAGGTRSVRHVSMSLRSFVPLPAFPDSETASPRRKARQANSQRALRSPRVEVASQHPSKQGFGQVLTLKPSASDAPNVRVTAVAYALTADGRMALTEDEIVMTWVGDDFAVQQGPSQSFPSGSVVELELQTHVPMALEVELRAEAVE